MIDIDKYETDNGCTLRIGLLRQDAPLLLEEVKRLRHELDIKEEALAKSQSSYKELRKQLKAAIE